MIPFLKWAGGKRTIAPFVKTLYEGSSCERVVEPFCGALSIALKINPKNCLLADSNKYLINLFNEIKKDPEFDDYSLKANEKDFYQIRLMFNQQIEHNILDRWSAEAFYYMNRTCYNGLCRFSKKKALFNSPYGNFKSPILLSDFSKYHEVFKDWNFRCQSFEDTFLETTESDFVFIDPPYFGNVFSSYTSLPFGESEHVRVAEMAAESPAKCVLTNSYEPLIIDLYKAMGFDIYCHEMPRSISCNGQRKPVLEIIAFKGISADLINSAKGSLRSFRKA